MKTGQILYTRCSPLFNVGQNRFEDYEEYGIFNLTDGMVDELGGKSIRIISKISGIRHKDSDCHAFWLHFRVSGKDVLLKNVNREYIPGKRRPNGKDLWPGNFTAQAIVGNFDAYSCDYIGNSIFDFEKTDESECYRLDYSDSKPELLPITELSVGKEDLNRGEKKSKCFIKILQFILSPDFGKKAFFIKETNEDFLKDISDAVRLFPVSLGNMIQYSTAGLAFADLGNVFNDRPLFDVIRMDFDASGRETESMRRNSRYSDVIISDANSDDSAPDSNMRNFIGHACKCSDVLLGFRQWLIRKVEQEKCLPGFGFGDVCDAFDLYEAVYSGTLVKDYESFVRIIGSSDRIFSSDAETQGKVRELMFSAYGRFISDDDDNGRFVFNRLIQEKDFVSRFRTSDGSNVALFDRLTSHFWTNGGTQGDLVEMQNWSKDVCGGRKTGSVIDVNLMLLADRLGKAQEDQVEIERMFSEAAAFFSDADVCASDIFMLFSEEIIGKSEKCGFLNPDAGVDVSFVCALFAFRSNPAFSSVLESYLSKAMARKGWLARILEIVKSVSDVKISSDVIEKAESMVSFSALPSSGNSCNGKKTAGKESGKGKGFFKSFFGK